MSNHTEPLRTQSSSSSSKTSTRRKKNGLAFYTTRDLILYALGIGCTPDHHEELCYLYEHYTSDGVRGTFRAFPLFILTLPFRAHGIPQSSNNYNHPTLSYKQFADCCCKNAFEIPRFPPYLMTCNCSTVNNNINHGLQSSSPIAIHVSQKFRLHHSIPIPKPLTTSNNNIHPNESTGPMGVYITTRIISIQPKSNMGYFVTTETNYYLDAITSPTHGTHHDDNSNKFDDCMTPNTNCKILLATSQSTVLYIIKSNQGTNQEIQKSLPCFDNRNGDNLDSNDLSYLNPPNIPSTFLSSSSHTLQNPHYTLYQYIPKHQAFLYRLSGDSNSIHVKSQVLFPPRTNKAMTTSNTSTTMDKKKNKNQTIQEQRPILHGLCTLGYVARLIQSHYCTIQNCFSNSNHEWEMSYISCQFTKPVHGGDLLRITIWNQNDYNQKEDYENGCFHLVRFQVWNNVTNTVVIQDGVMELQMTNRECEIKKEMGDSNRKDIRGDKVQILLSRSKL